MLRESFTLDWDAGRDRYIRDSANARALTDSRNCTRRLAEEAMWEARYADALALYAEAETLPAYVDPDEIDPANLPEWQARIRDRRISYD